MSVKQKSIIILGGSDHPLFCLESYESVSGRIQDLRRESNKCEDILPPLLEVTFMAGNEDEAYPTVGMFDPADVVFIYAVPEAMRE